MFGFGLGWIDDLGRERAQTYTNYFWAENIPIFVFFFFFLRIRKGPAPLDECEIYLISLEFRDLPMGFMGLRLKYNPSPFSHNFKTHKIKMK